MTLSEAISIRSSLRTYLPDPISEEQRRQLGKAIARCNQRSGLHVQLICGRPEPFSDPEKTRGILSGVQNYFLFAGPRELEDLEEKCGYFGEELLLTAADMGLGTCWVGGTYDREACLAFLAQGEELVCAASVGHTAETRAGREALLRRWGHRETRSAAELSEGLDRAPAWFAAGVEAVQRAPSAANKQGVRFRWEADGAVRGEMTREGPFALVDLGIAKLHFELGAHGGAWTWGDGGVFEKAAEEKSCGAVVWRDAGGAREYLLARHNGGHWSFPKGHVEQGEQEAETAAREILEETGLTADIDTGFRRTVTFYPKPGVVKDVVFFTARMSGGREHAQEEEIADLGWFPLREARELVTYASDEEVLLAAEEYLGRDRR